MSNLQRPHKNVPPAHRGRRSSGTSMPLSPSSAVVVGAAPHGRPANTPKRPVRSTQDALKRTDRPQHRRVDAGHITPLFKLKRGAQNATPGLRSTRGPIIPHRLAALNANKAKRAGAMPALMRGMQDGGRSSNVITQEVLPERTYASVVKYTDKIGGQGSRLGAVTAIRGTAPSRTAAHHTHGVHKGCLSGNRLSREMGIVEVGGDARRQIQRSIRGLYKARPVQESAPNATSSRRKRMPPRSTTDILPDPRPTNLKTSSGQRSSASTNMVHSKPERIQRPNTPRLLVRNRTKQTSADGDELADTANRTAIWLLQSATDVDWSEFSRVRANANQARQIASRMTGDQRKGIQTVIPSCKYKPSRMLTYLHSDLHQHRQAGQRWRTMSEDERHEAAMEAFSNGSVEATNQAISMEQLSAHEMRD